MAINFPTSLDSLTNPETSNPLNSPSHAGQHSDANDAIEALEAKVGANSSAVPTSHDYKIAQLESTRITASSTDTLTNKTIDANGTGNSISNIEVADLASGVLDTDLSSVSATDNTIPSAKATKAMGDLKLPLAGGTMSGPIVQGSYINLSSPASDHTATGVATNAFQSGATVSAFQLVMMGSSSKWILVDADAVATCKGLIGIALEAKNDTQAMLVALPGSFVRDDSWAWTVGATLYAGETPGAIQETIPTGADAIIKVIGFAVSADVIFFNPSPDQQSTIA